MAQTRGWKSARWDPSTPAFNSYETSDGAPLTTDYNLSTDGRFPGILQLGPLLTTIDCAAADGAAPSVTNVIDMVFSETMETEDYLMASRGKRPAMIATSTRTLSSNGTATAFAANADRRSVFTLAEAGTEEISVPITGNNAYQVITAISGASHTFTPNNEAIVNHIFGKNTSKDAAGQVFGFGLTAAIENTVRSNPITGVVTMDASAWVERSQMTAFYLKYTGVAWWNNFIYVGANIGPFYVNDDFQAFQLRIPEAANSPNDKNCVAMFAWSKLGVVIPMLRETRLFINAEGVRIGPEAFENNTSPIRGRMTAGDANELWAMVAIYNQFTDQTYICAMRPRMGKENSIHTNQVSYFPIAVLTAGHECEAIRWGGTKGGVSRGTWYIGDDDDVDWCIEGLSDRFPDDTGVLTYAASGTWVGTEKRFPISEEKKPRYVSFETANCAVGNETVNIQFTYVDRTGTSRTTTGMVTITRNGKQIVEVPKAMQFWATRFKPVVTMARGATTTNTPRLIGDIEVIYEFREAGDVGLHYFDFASGTLRQLEGD